MRNLGAGDDSDARIFLHPRKAGDAFHMAMLNHRRLKMAADLMVRLRNGLQRIARHDLAALETVTGFMNRDGIRCQRIFRAGDHRQCFPLDVDKQGGFFRGQFVTGNDNGDGIAMMTHMAG